MEIYGCSGCYGSCFPSRGFPTKEEKIKALKDYKEELENEAKGVAERIAQLEED